MVAELGSTTGPLARNATHEAMSAEALTAQIVELRNRLVAQETLIGQASNQHAELQQRIALSEQQNQKLAEALDESSKRTEAAVMELNSKLADARCSGRGDKQRLINSRDMKCSIFTGKEPYKPWAKKLKAYCNGLVSGFRQALEWAEKQTTAIDQTELLSTNWQWITEADQELYDLLVMTTSEDAATIVELSTNHGFEAWRTLYRRMDPVGEDYEFEAAESLMTRDRCKDIVDLPAAIERWQRDLNLYQERTGEKMPERWSVPVLFRMIPLKNYQEVKLRWRQDKDKNITKFMSSLLEWANDLKFDQRRQRGPKPMDVDAVSPEKDANGYTLEDWNDYARELEASVDWMGKGKKGRKGLGKGKGGKGACYWCGEQGHTKANCHKFAAWKKAKDEERKKKGLPPFQPRAGKGVNSIENGDYDDVTGQEDVGMLGFDFDCDALDEFACHNCGATEHSQCDCEDWDLIGDAKEMMENDELEIILQKQKHNVQVRKSPVPSENKFGALEEDDDMDLDVLDAKDEPPEKDETPVRKLFLVDGLYNSPATSSPGTSLAQTFAREREELLLKQAAKKSPERATPPQNRTEAKKTAEPPNEELLPTPPGISGKEVGVQTNIELPEKITITWVPVADALAPQHDGPKGPEMDDERIIDQADDVNAVDCVDDKESLEDLIFGEEPIEPSAREDETRRMEESVWLIMMTIYKVAWIATMMLASMNQQKEINEGDSDEFFRKLFEDESEEEKEAFMDCEDPSGPLQASIDEVGKPESGATRMKLKKGITVDSGAHHNVMPRRMARGAIRASEGSIRGMNYVAANKGKIPNEGETDFEFTTSDGVRQSWEFQIAEVNKALAAVSDRVDHDFRVVFDKDSKTGADASYMLHKPSQKIIKMTRINNAWIVEAIVDVKTPAAVNFARRG